HRTAGRAAADPRAAADEGHRRARTAPRRRAAPVLRRRGRPMIRTTAVLVRHSFARMRGLVLGLAALLGAFAFLLTQMAAYLFRHSAFASLAALMPDFMRNLAGPFSLAVMSFSGIVAFGYFHPMVVTALLALTIAVATEPAAEAEMLFVDLTLARPVQRADLLARTLFLAAAA